MIPDGVALPVYGPPVEETLLGAADRGVEVVGKVIDTGGGSGIELWVADPSSVRVHSA